MQILTLIFSALAFLMGATALILTIRERVRSRRSVKFLRKALVDYVDKKSEEVYESIVSGVKEQMEAAGRKSDKAVSFARVANGRVDAIKKVVKENKGRIDLLEQGCVPDYNEALRAVNAVNEMNSGIANIFGFDPLEALQKSEQGGK